MTRNRILDVILGCAFLLMNAGMILLFWMYFWQGNPPVEFTNMPFPVDRVDRVYYPGDEVTLYVEYRKHVDAAVTVSSSLVDSYLVQFPDVHISGVSPATGNATGAILLTFTIPKNFIPAEEDLYHLEGVNAYEVNPIATRRVRWVSEAFRIKLPVGSTYRPGIRPPVTTPVNGEQVNIPFIDSSVRIHINPPNVEPPNNIKVTPTINVQTDRDTPYLPNNNLKIEAPHTPPVHVDITTPEIHIPEIPETPPVDVKPIFDILDVIPKVEAPTINIPPVEVKVPKL